MTTPYYDLRVCRMDTDTPFEETPTVDAYGRPWPPGDYATDDPEDGTRHELRGVAIGLPLSPEDLRAMCNEYFYAGEQSAIMAEVVDNGVNGDGLWLRLSPEIRHEGSAGEAEPLLSVRLTPRQALVLAEALSAAARLRMAQETSP